MPKTYTDDVAAVLPSAIDGPFEVADAADHNDYVKIEPALARISAAGNARPLRRHSIGYYRTTGTSSATTLATAISCRMVAPGNDGGFYSYPIGIPSEMDLTAPCSLFLLIAAAAHSTLPGVSVRLEVLAGYTKDGQATPETKTVTYDHPVPDAWQEDSAEFVRIDDGNGRTFAPNSFESGDVVGLRVQLARSAAADTFDQSVKLATCVVFEYTAKEF